mgnify:FL=1
MDFKDVINNRHTTRSFKNEEVDFESIKRILDVGLKAPSNNHMR